MPLARITIQQAGAPPKHVAVQRLRNKNNTFGLRVSTPDGTSPPYRQRLTLSRLTNPDNLRRLSADIRTGPTSFKVVADDQTFTVKTSPLDAGRVRFDFGDGLSAIVNFEQENDAQAMAMVAAVVVVVVVIIIITVAVVVHIITESGNSEAEVGVGDREEDGEGSEEGGDGGEEGNEG